MCRSRSFRCLLSTFGATVSGSDAQISVSCTPTLTAVHARHTHAPISATRRSPRHPVATTGLSSVMMRTI